MSEKADSISFKSIKPLDILQVARSQANKTNLGKEQIEFVSNSTDIKALKQYLEIINNMIQKEESKGFLTTFGDTILSVFGCKSVDIESLKALKNLIIERINLIMFTT